MLKVVISKKPFSSYSAGQNDKDTAGFRYLIGTKTPSPYVKMVKDYGTDNEISRIVNVTDWDHDTIGFVMISDSFGWFCSHITAHTIQNRKGIALINHTKKGDSVTLLLPASERSYQSYVRKTCLEV